MDQVKVILQQAVKHRFWIAVGLAALLPMIGYFVGAGPVQAKAKAETEKITSAHKDAQQYASGDVKNAQWSPLVSDKTAVLAKDVYESWTSLYARQAPLLTWPEVVHDRFTEWGRKWPEDVSPNLVQSTITDYVEAYPAEVDKVYATMRPWDPMKGEGVVVAPPKEQLLRPAPFDTAEPPTLGKVWAAQERLWVQRTLLEVIAEVNRNASNWDEAIIKQVTAIEVGNYDAQDQRSISAGEALEEAPDLSPEGEEAYAEEGGDAGYGGEMGGMMGGYGGMMGGRGGPAGEAESVYYIASESTQFKTLPVKMVVLIDQERMQDLLIALENSPMSVQVRDFEWNRPTTRVTKPVKGEMMAFGGYGGMMGGMFGGMMGGEMGEMGGYGSMPGGYGGMMGMGRGGMMGGYGGMMGGEMGGMPGYGGMMGGYGGMGQAAKGVDKRGTDKRKEREDREKAEQKRVVRSSQDQYYNIVEVIIHGQARFYNAPTAEDEPAEPTSDFGEEMAGEEELPAADPAAPAPADPAAPAPEAVPAEPKAEEPGAPAEDPAGAGR